MRLYQSRPTLVEAVEWTGDLLDRTKLETLAPRKVAFDADGQLSLLAGKDGAQGWVAVPVGHFIVRLPEDPSDVWPVEGEYFRARYHHADD